LAGFAASAVDMLAETQVATMAWLVSGTTPKFENVTAQVMSVTMPPTVVVPGTP
jgi:hypothetical protein